MKKRLEALFYNSKDGKEKISDLQLLVGVGLSVAMILFCVAAMSLSAYAFFTHHVATEIQPIRSASYEIESQSDDGLVMDGSGVYTLDNSAGNEARVFPFILTKTSDSTASVGYCELVIRTDLPNADSEDGAYHFYTQPIGTFLEDGAEVEVNKRTVWIRVEPRRVATVSFHSQWGSTAKEALEDRKWTCPLFTELTAEEQQSIQEALNPTPPIDPQEESSPGQSEQAAPQAEENRQEQVESSLQQQSPPATEEQPIDQADSDLSEGGNEEEDEAAVQQEGAAQEEPALENPSPQEPIEE